jgi:hypothetical protein
LSFLSLFLPDGSLFSAERQRLLAIEVLREAATIVMLATVAYALVKSRREWLAYFFIAFGVWDIS